MSEMDYSFDTYYKSATYTYENIKVKILKMAINGSVKMPLHKYHMTLLVWFLVLRLTLSVPRRIYATAWLSAEAAFMQLL